MRGFWRHEACLDLYADMRMKFCGSKYRVVRATWYVRGMRIGITQTIRILNSELSRWKPCSPEGEIK